MVETTGEDKQREVAGELHNGETSTTVGEKVTESKEPEPLNEDQQTKRKFGRDKNSEEDALTEDQRDEQGETETMPNPMIPTKFDEFGNPLTNVDHDTRNENLNKREETHSVNKEENQA